MGLTCKVLLTLAAMTLAACASAPEKPSPQAAAVTAKPKPNPFSACRESAPADEALLDETERRVHQTVCGAALWFDSLFGDKGDLRAARSSYGHVAVATEYSEFFGPSTRLRFNARIRLPTLEDRLSAFVGLDDEDDFVRDRSQGRLRTPTQQRNLREEFLAGLGFLNIRADRLESEFRVGVRNLRLPKVFVQNRFTYVGYSDEAYRLVLRATPFWNNRDGTGLTLGNDLDRALGKDFLLRWANVATRVKENPSVDWRSSLVLYQDLSRARALAYELFIRGATQLPEPLTEYGLRGAYRQPLYEKKLFAELVLGYSWPRTDPSLDREGAYLVGIGLEMPFGKVPPSSD